MAPNCLHHNSDTVCVMDASGKLGSTLVHQLLQRGYIVHAAIQHHGEMKVENGLSCEMKKKLKVFQADPFDYHGIVDALRGCCGLFYTYEQPQDDEYVYDEFTAEEEARAAHNVLEACSQTPTMEKVVFTSSVSSIIWRDDRNSLAADLDERNWSDISFCRKYKLWHALSKTLAEKTAWALAMDREMTMVSINGGLLMSPDLTIKNPYLKGAAEMYEDGVFVTVDLRFLANAHIRVYEDVSSYGRYICFNNVINKPDTAAKLARMLTPSSMSSAPQCYGADMQAIQQRISNKKLNKLMVDFETNLTIER